MIKTLKGFILNQDGPWGPINDNDKNKGNKPEKNIEDEFDEIIKKGQKFFESVFNKKGSNSGGNNKNKNNNPPVKSVLGIAILTIAALWLATGFYKVDSDENAVVLYFGKFHSITTPGLNYRIPAPFSKVIKRSVIKVNTEEFGASFNKSSYKSPYSNSSGNDDSLMLTGDENIVDIDFQIQWQISDIEKFVFNIADLNACFTKVSTKRNERNNSQNTYC